MENFVLFFFWFFWFFLTTWPDPGRDLIYDVIDLIGLFI